MFWPDAGGHTPWREEIGVQENAAGQMRHSQDVGQCVHADLLPEAGVSVMSPGGPVIDARSTGNLQMTVSRPVRPFYCVQKGLHRTRGGMEWWPRSGSLHFDLGQICRLGQVMIVCSCNVFSDHQLRSTVANATQRLRMS